MTMISGKRIAIVGLAVAAALAFAPRAAAAPATNAATGSGGHYYLSLGDSLASGYQPIGGSPFGDGYNQGYADRLLKARPRTRRPPAAGQARLRQRNHHDDDPRRLALLRLSRFTTRRGGCVHERPGPYKAFGTRALLPVCCPESRVRGGAGPVTPHRATTRTSILGEEGGG